MITHSSSSCVVCHTFVILVHGSWSHFQFLAVMFGLKIPVHDYVFLLSGSLSNSSSQSTPAAKSANAPSSISVSHSDDTTSHALYATPSPCWSCCWWSPALLCMPASPLVLDTGAWSDAVPVCGLPSCLLAFCGDLAEQIVSTWKNWLMPVWPLPGDNFFCCRLDGESVAFLLLGVDGRNFEGNSAGNTHTHTHTHTQMTEVEWQWRRGL